MQRAGMYINDLRLNDSVNQKHSQLTQDKSSGSMHSSGLIPFRFELAAINRRAAG